MTTTAEIISSLYDDDGTTFSRQVGDEIVQQNIYASWTDGYVACIDNEAAAKAETHTKPVTGVDKYIFPDGSAIVIGSDCWDLAVNDDPDCACFREANFGRCYCEQPEPVDPNDPNVDEGDIMRGDEIEVLADWANPASPVRWRPLPDWDELGWQPTVFQAADLRSDAAVEAVERWLEGESG